MCKKTARVPLPTASDPISNDNLAPLVEEVRWMARTLVQRLPHANITVDELISAGLLALVEASRRYDPSRGADLLTFAKYRIHGAMLDELRQLDTVSRERRRAIRDGKDSPVAPPAPRLVDLDCADLVPDDRTSADELVSRGRWIERLESARHTLPERLRLVLHLRMEADWSLREIAELLGVTQGRACQLVGKGVQHLREVMDIDLDELAA